MNEFKEYLIELDKYDTKMIDDRVAEKGIEEYLNQQLIYLDCSRIIKGLRMMQTIGFPYKKEITSYIYAIDNCVNFMTVEDNNPNNFSKEYWINLLLDRHHKNLEYEKENPPIWYDGKPKKVNKRKPKAKEGDMFPKEDKPKISKAEARLKAKLITADLGFGTFKLKK